MYFVTHCVFISGIQRHAALPRRSCQHCSSMLWSTKQMYRKTHLMIALSCQRWYNTLNSFRIQTYVHRVVDWQPFIGSMELCPCAAEL